MEGSTKFCYSLCNVGTRDIEQPLAKALYRFHTYYHIRRILKQMLTPLPGTEGFNKYNNAFDLDEVRRIGDEYGVTTKSLGIFKNEYYFERMGREARRLMSITTGLGGS